MTSSFRNNDEIYGLILSGGKSLRMGADKGQLDYHGVPQRDYLYEELSKVCKKVFLSTRSDQQITSSIPQIVDSVNGTGPTIGILSALNAFTNHPFLVVACDLPFVSVETFLELLKARDPSYLATCFFNEKRDSLEPLISLYEPELKKVFQEELSQGVTCPRKILNRQKIKKIRPSYPLWLENANTEQDYLSIKEQLKGVH